MSNTTKIIARPLTASGIALVKELQGLRGQASDAAFYRDHLMAFMGPDSTKWTKLQRNLDAGGSYTGRTVELEPKLAEARNALVEKRRFSIVKSTGPAPIFHETAVSRQLFTAIEILRNETDECRMIFLLLNAACGKSALLREAQNRYGGKIAQCTILWRYSLGTCIKDTAKSYGINGPFSTRHEWWNHLVEARQRSPDILSYDDFHRGGPSAVDMVCDLNTATQEYGGVQICAMIPEFYQRLKSKGFFESYQSSTRSIIIDRGSDAAGNPLPDVLPEEVAQFLGEKHFAGNPRDLAERLCGDCNRFGHLRLVKRVLKMLPKGTPEQPISNKDFDDALRCAKRSVAREFGGGK